MSRAILCFAWTRRPQAASPVPTVGTAARWRLGEFWSVRRLLWFVGSIPSQSSIIAGVNMANPRDKIASLSTPLNTLLYGSFMESGREKINFSQAVYQFCCEEMKSACDAYLASIVTNMDDALILIDYGLEETSNLLVGSCLQLVLRELPSSLHNPKVRKYFVARRLGRNWRWRGIVLSCCIISSARWPMEDSMTSAATMLLLERLKECATEKWQKALAMHQLGCVLLERREYKEAHACFEAAADSGHVYSMVGVARTRYKQGKMFSAAWFFIALEDYESALRDIRALLTLEPNYMMFTEDKRLNCQKAAMRSLRLAQNNAISKYERLIYEGWILYDTGYREEALSKAELSISIQRSFEAFFLKAYVLADTSLDSESLSHVIELLEEALKCPSDGLRKGQALNNLGSIYVDCGDLDLAAQCYMNALDIKHTRAHQGLARVYHLKSSRKDAYNEMTKLIEKAQNNASAYEKRSEYGDRDMANADLEWQQSGSFKDVSIQIQSSSNSQNGNKLTSFQKFLDYVPSSLSETMVDIPGKANPNVNRKQGQTIDMVLENKRF
ncbi:unnamed protein product [Thlaspi arvense]|uniref:Uncharacterized protein n=1 Tax=Thlaspi arvense TaxID=13288 RepID=A0AAU9RW84_THLAR|nr:unnamed protein product [Thlaspi arvense]